MRCEIDEPLDIAEDFSAFSLSLFWLALEARPKGCVVREKPQASRRRYAQPVVATAKHKFAAGSYVILVGKPDAALFKIRDCSLMAAPAFNTGSRTSERATSALPSSGC